LIILLYFNKPKTDIKFNIMKIIAPLIFILIYSCSTKKPIEYGSLTGNIYWKYNNFVGNKPDAGSDIKVFSLKDSTLTYKAVADVRGDYRIDSIPTGYYLVSIESENTKTDGIECFENLDRHKRDLDTVFKTNISQLLNRHAEKINNFVQLARKGLLDNNGGKALDLYSRYNDSARHYADIVIDSLPKKFLQEFIIIGTGGSKLNFKTVNIQKGKTENIVTDFGITYF
jgi:hypothetical protein